ncbi:folate family ECF transporter S component [Aerococcus kribbianus]|uniref:Folate family ECF transporter S component n=1 Tax=Aerococcus kribbianus TaxID=2999064 RepID=A0A9X3FQ82_9LACT|nr:MULTISPECIES: folate family ECF transporter S component [unclassified Aerococcus]MCZ0717999.1 folate family ECF transporter S component [Aerococcus sp. YH-aer221]MCZ0726286.1 folate family ECF transporter S component [Aerococcus sp. YH-aer222]
MQSRRSLIGKKSLSTQNITLMALVIAFRLALGMLPAISIPPFVQIGFGFIGSALMGALLGPALAAGIGGIVDVLDFFIGGGSWGYFFPGYTLSAIVAGYFYGKGFYRQDVTWKRTFMTVLLNTLVVNLLLGSLWVYLMTDKGLFAILPIRLVKNLISLPLNTFIIYKLLNHPTIKRLLREWRI